MVDMKFEQDVDSAYAALKQMALDAQIRAEQDNTPYVVIRVGNEVLVIAANLLPSVTEFDNYELIYTTTAGQMC